MTDRNDVLNLIKNASSIIPNETIEDLPTKEFEDVPQWHKFEYEIWDLGEKIRQMLVRDPLLRKDQDIEKGILEVAMNPNAKRGRQSFVLLLGSVKHAHLANNIVADLVDKNVNGHVIDTLLKMRVGNYVEKVKPFTSSDITWIRNKAKKYCERYGQL